MLQPNRAKHIKIRFLLALCILLTEYPCLLPREFVAWVRYRVSSLDILGKMHGHCLGFCPSVPLPGCSCTRTQKEFIQCCNPQTCCERLIQVQITPSKTTMSIKIASRHAHRPITMFIILWVALHC